LEIVNRFQVSESARNPGKAKGGYHKTRDEALEGAWSGEYQTIVVSAIDRVTREGAEGNLRIIRQFRERGCTLLSVRERWLNSSPEIADVLVAFAGWSALSALRPPHRV
jgi:DNA invertase Pin-like site-specific DNA recombinase